MLTLHHLEDSRSHRLLWLFEELGLDYEIVRYSRDPETRLASPELQKVHPLGKSPVLTDGGRTIAESAAIIDYVIRRHGGGRLAPEPGSDAHEAYLELMHYGEGSMVMPLILDFYVQRLGAAGAPLHPRIKGEALRHLAYVDERLGERGFLAGGELTGADILISFNLQMARMLGWLHDFPRLGAYLDRLEARPAYKAAVERGGGYNIGRVSGPRRA